MKKGIIRAGIIVLLTLIIGTSPAIAQNISLEEGLEKSNYNINMKRDLLCLMMAYPEHITSVEKGEDDRVYIVMKSGKKVIYDDKKQKSFNEKLNNPDLQDMLEQVYPLSHTGKLMPESFDPGRVRVYSLFKEVYGNSKQQIEGNLANTKAGYRYSLFNSSNKASEALQSAMKELTSLTQSKKGLYPFVFPTQGTFNYRLIAGTNQLSVHSFGIAIDLATSKYDYWKWATREQGEKRLSIYPKEVVEVMEKNNFIWGGKWGHFDIMHYEYRPELIIKARYFSEESSKGDIWYGKVDSTAPSIKGLIQMIDKVIDSNL